MGLEQHNTMMFAVAPGISVTTNSHNVSFSFAFAAMRSPS